MHWTLYDLPPEFDDQERDPDPPDGLADLEGNPDFPTLTDCPYCGSRQPEECGCFD